MKTVYGLPSGKKPAPPTPAFAVLDDPGLLFVKGVVEPEETGIAAVERLTAFVTATVAPALRSGDKMSASNAFGAALGINPFTEAMLGRNPYFAAFALGRRMQLGVEPRTLMKAVRELKKEDWVRARDAFLSPERRCAVVVGAK
jgi:hypothetical protein